MALILGSGSICRADGGMWFLALMEQQHLADSLKKAGLKLKPNQVYSETQPSLKDAVGIFGGGCTGEIVSPNGLVLTNNHCGYSYVHAMSTLEANYLQDGYFAHSLKEELPVPRLTFTFVLGVEDVTEYVNEKAKQEGVDEYTMQSRRFLGKLTREVFERSRWSQTPGARAEIDVFYNGNQFYAIFTQTFRDVRLVANPPLQIGQFGQNQDNWIWPRHNADFAMFRIYADKEGNPAAYSEDNVPLRREKYLHVSLADLKEGDYAMIMGFPGSTDRYLSASQLQLRMESQYAPMVLVGEPVLEQNRKEMARNDSVRLAMQNSNFSLGNVVKNYGGAIESVNKTKLIDKKRDLDNRLLAFAKQQADGAEVVKAVSRLNEIQKAYTDSLFDANLVGFGLRYLAPRVDGRAIVGLSRALQQGNDSLFQASASAVRSSLGDAEAIAQGKRYSDLILPILQQNARLDLTKEYVNTVAQRLASAQTTSVFSSVEAFDAFAANPSAEALSQDPVFLLLTERMPEALMNAYGRVEGEELSLSKIYTRGLMDFNNGQTPPDANFTLRLTYGHIKGYSPRDAVRYDYRTVLDGMFEKENPKDVDYVIDEPLRSKFLQGDFGRYARPDGKLPACFLSDNDITGGNSGSPVMNAKGELIGLAFDGNIESLASDFAYNAKLQRCINVDIRFVLWVIDTYGGASYVLDEMTIKK